jgi:putative FmdB family regulatory protein
MPIYEYDCPDCGRFEVIQKVDEKPVKECPTCKEKGRKNKVTRAVSSSSFHLKGSGWYKTDYGSSGSADSATKSASTTSSATTKSETKSEEKPAKKACGTGCGCH